MKKYYGLDLSTVSVDNNGEILGNDASYVDACTKAWCIWMIAEKHDQCLRYEVSQNTKSMFRFSFYSIPIAIPSLIPYTEQVQ